MCTIHLIFLFICVNGVSSLLVYLCVCTLHVNIFRWWIRDYLLTVWFIFDYSLPWNSSWTHRNSSYSLLVFHFLSNDETFDGLNFAAFKCFGRDCYVTACYFVLLFAVNLILQLIIVERSYLIYKCIANVLAIPTGSYCIVSYHVHLIDIILCVKSSVEYNTRKLHWHVGQ